jgi:hypothetical protein
MLTLSNLKSVQSLPTDVLKIIASFGKYVQCEGTKVSYVQVDIRKLACISKYDQIFTCRELAKKIHVYDIHGNFLFFIFDMKTKNEISFFCGIQNIWVLNEELIVYDAIDISRNVFFHVKVFSLNGMFVRSFNLKNANGIVCFPSSVSLTANGLYFFRCFGDKHVEHFLVYTSKGDFVKEFNPKLSSQGNLIFQNSSLILDKDDNVYVHDEHNPCIYIFHFNGTFRHTLYNYYYKYFIPFERFSFQNAIISKNNEYVVFTYSNTEHMIQVDFYTLEKKINNEQQKLRTFKIKSERQFIGISSSGRFLVKFKDKILFIQ